MIQAVRNPNQTERAGSITYTTVSDSAYPRTKNKHMATKIIIDHLVISVTDLAKSTKFYGAFLGKAKAGKEDTHFVLGSTKLFLTSPYKQSAQKFNKHNIGLNHIAFQMKSLPMLRGYVQKLDKAHIAHSQIQIDTFSLKQFVYFDDPDGIRLEFYIRKLV